MAIDMETARSDGGDGGDGGAVAVQNAAVIRITCAAVGLAMSAAICLSVFAVDLPAELAARGGNAVSTFIWPDTGRKGRWIAITVQPGSATRPDFPGWRLRYATTDHGLLYRDGRAWILRSEKAARVTWWFTEDSE